MPSLDRCSERTGGRAVSSLQLVSDKSDAVVVMAQQALAAAALGWQERAERLAEVNTRLKNRVAEVENAHRKSMTVVKNVPALPNNHVFTKQLIYENYSLRRETRALQRRLMQFEGARPKSFFKTPRKVQNKIKKTTERQSALVTKLTEAPNHVSMDKECDQGKAGSSASIPLLQKLKAHLRHLELDLDRLKKENEILRAELDQYELSKNTAAPDTKLLREGDNNAVDEDQQQLRAEFDAVLRQMKGLEARYQNFEEKARAKTVLYLESTSRLKEATTQLFETQQQVAAQRAKLHLYSDQTARINDLKDETHLLRSENLTLNETISTLSSRPFDALSKDLQSKNMCIAKLEEEKRIVEEECAKFQANSLATSRTNAQLRRRVEAVTQEVKNLALELNHVKAECERTTMEKEVAQLQLRFYTVPSDYGVMSAVGKAIKEMKKQHYRGVEDKVDCESDVYRAVDLLGEKGSMVSKS